MKGRVAVRRALGVAAAHPTAGRPRRRRPPPLTAAPRARRAAMAAAAAAGAGRAASDPAAVDPALHPVGAGPDGGQRLPQLEPRRRRDPGPCFPPPPPPADPKPASSGPSESLPCRSRRETRDSDVDGRSGAPPIRPERSSVSQADLRLLIRPDGSIDGTLQDGRDALPGYICPRPTPPHPVPYTLPPRGTPCRPVGRVRPAGPLALRRAAKQRKHRLPPVRFAERRAAVSIFFRFCGPLGLRPVPGIRSACRPRCGGREAEEMPALARRGSAAWAGVGLR